MQPVDISPTSEESVLVTWPEKICPVQHQLIISAAQIITSQHDNVIFESIVSYNSMILYYHFQHISYPQLQQHILASIHQAEINAQIEKASQETIDIPVYYGEKVAWDLAEVAKQCQLSVTEVISLHSQRTYRAYALGFTPGFCYLGSLDKKLRLPRKSTPRVTVPKGAVAIAEQQTAIYPNISPGGWHIIGQTPIEMFQKNETSFRPKISLGQQVKFIPINKQTFIELTEENSRGCQK